MMTSVLNDFAMTWSETMLRVCWQGGIAVLCVWTLCKLFRRLRPDVKCWLWRLVYLKLLVTTVWVLPVEIPLLPARLLPPLPAVACDEIALQGPRASIAEYAKLLLSVHNRRRSRVLSLAAGIGESYYHLEGRLDAMKRFEPRSRRATVVGVLLLVIVGIVGVVPWRVTAQEPGGVVDTLLDRLIPGREATAQAQLLVLSPEPATPEAPDNKAFMPTHAAIVRSHVVLKDAIGRIPKEHRANLNELPKEKQIVVLRGNLTVRPIRNTNLLKLQYRSEDPAAAVAVLNAIIDAYVEFLGQSQRGVSADVMKILKEELAKLEKRIESKEKKLQRLLSDDRSKNQVEIEFLKSEIARHVALNNTIRERLSQIELSDEASGVRVRVVEPPQRLMPRGDGE